MESQYILTINGQEITQADLNTVGQVSGLADDRVLDELFRPTPFDGTNVSRLIIPYGNQGNAVQKWLAGATGGIAVNPFRAMVGSRTAVGTSPLDNWRDCRSSVWTGAAALSQVLNFASNSSGFSRWDLIYAKISVNVNGTSVTRYSKDPTTLVVASNSIATFKISTVTLGTVTGTPSATPALPAVPADSGSDYYIPLAFTYLLNGYTSGTIVSDHQIFTVAPITGMQSNASGAMQVRPASSLHDYSSSGSMTATVLSNWAATNSLPPWYLSPEAAGGDSVFVLLDMHDASSANWSHTSGSIIDIGKPWTNRYFTWMAYFGSTTAPFGSSILTDGVNVSPYGPNQWHAASMATNVQMGFGQSFVWDTSLQVTSLGKGAVVYTTGSDGFGHTWKLGVYIDFNNVMRLYFDFGGGSGAFGYVILRIDAITNPTIV